MNIKILTIGFSLLGMVACNKAPEIQMVTSTEDSCWQQPVVFSAADKDQKAVSIINTTNVEQQIEGFGACFNELGWTSLSKLSA